MDTPEYELLAQRAAGSPPMVARNLPLVSEADAPPEVARLYAQFRSRFGLQQVPGILQCFATHPPLLEHMMAMSESLLFSDGALNRRQKEMIATFVSSINNCDYCSDSHGFFFRVHGGSVKSLAALLVCDLDAGNWTNAERALLEFVAAVNQGSESVSPAGVQNLRDQGWTDLQIAEAIHLTALFVTFNRVVNAFGLPSRQLLADATLLNGQGLAKSGAGLRLVAGQDLSQSGARSQNSGDAK
jgi:uncharacterized peroxidase-related enzyme